MRAFNIGTMPWNKMFVSAQITKANENAYQLKIIWTWYNITNYEESFLFSSLEEAKKKFIEIRSNDRLSAIDADGTPLKL
jgi:hypothetical protein